MKLIDSHCHLDDFFSDGTLLSVLERAKNALIDQMIAIGTHAKDWEFYNALVKSHNNIFYTVGIHPIYANQSQDFDQLEKFLNDPFSPIAIGEIGLDYHRLSGSPLDRETEINNQKTVFIKQLDVAKKYDLPVVIHSRDAFSDTVDMLSSSGISGEKILFHCYDYGVDELLQLKNFGSFISFSGMLTFKKKLIEPLKVADLNKVLIETDCPYLTPAIYKGERNEPSYLRATAEFAADILNMSETEFCNVTHNNTKKFFGI